MLVETSIAKTRSIPFLSNGAKSVPICGPDDAKINSKVERRNNLCFHLYLFASILITTFLLNDYQYLSKVYFFYFLLLA
tara:strand:+ start:564 stop:800 length:237 start_codon:yes stop_codon:yes gene_type:complete